MCSEQMERLSIVIDILDNVHALRMLMEFDVTRVLLIIGKLRAVMVVNAATVIWLDQLMNNVIR